MMDRPRGAWWRPTLTAAACALGCLPFLLDFAAWTTGDLSRVQKLRRYGEDMSVATTAWQERRRPSGAPAIRLSSPEAIRHGFALQEFVVDSARRHGLRPWQFWRTLPEPPPPRPGLVVHRNNDDTGRALFTLAGFRLLGGVAPFLPLWLAALLCLPVLGWLTWELVRAGYTVAAALFALAWGWWPFAVESMALPYSGFGFQLVFLLGLGALATYAVLGRPSTRGLMARALVLGLLLAVCALCRNGAMLELPGVALALVVGTHRARGGGRLQGRASIRAGAVALSALLIVALPFFAVRPRTQHEVWLGVWQGLGDYDRTKGHVWSDTVALRLLLGAGFEKGVPEDVEIFDRQIASPETEAFFKSLVLRDVRSDPLWYLGILARRVAATLSQEQLLVLGGRAHPSLRLAHGPGAPIAPNQGRIRFYYRLVTTADWVGVGPWRTALPVWALCVPLVLLLAAAGWNRGRCGPRPALLALACVAAAVLPQPVLVTTAGALETQAFVLVDVLALAFFGDWAWREASARGVRA
jgi:hypothetical protein